MKKMRVSFNNLENSDVIVTSACSSTKVHLYREDNSIASASLYNWDSTLNKWVAGSSVYLFNPAYDDMEIDKFYIWNDNDSDGCVTDMSELELCNKSHECSNN